MRLELLWFRADPQVAAVEACPAPPGCAEATTDFRLSDFEKKKRKGAIKAQLVYRTNFQSTEQPRTDLMRFAVETSCVAT